MIPINDIKLIRFLNWFDKHGYDISRYLYGDKDYRNEKEEEYSKQNMTFPKLPAGMIGYMCPVEEDMSAYRESLLAKPQLLKNFSYKCILLCNNIHSDFKFSELLLDGIKQDLHVASREFLDIIYEEKTDLTRTGYKYIQELELDIDPNKIPCILLWKDRLENNVLLNIKGLKSIDVSEIIIELVTYAKKRSPLKYIAQEINILYEKKIKEKQIIESKKNNAGYVQPIIIQSLTYNDHSANLGDKAKIKKSSINTKG